MIDPLEVFAARFAASVGLQAALPGGLHTGRARSDTARPYGVVNLASESPRWTTEADDYTESVRVQVSIFADSAASARAAARAVARDDPDGFDRISGVALDNGAVATSIRDGGSTTLNETAGQDGKRSWMVTMDYLLIIGRGS